MSDQFSKPLYGQFKFQLDADRASTVKNFKLAGNSVTVTPASNAANLDGSLSCSFIVSNNANTTFTVTNLVDGQRLRLVFTNTHGSNAVTNVFTSMTGVSSSIAASKIVVFVIFKVGTVVYFTQTALS